MLQMCSVTIQLISQVVLLLALGFMAYKDLKSGQIPIVFIAVMFCTGILLTILAGKPTLIELLAGILIGALLTLLSFLSHGAIGLGDGLVFIAAGAFLGFTQNLELLLLSFLFSAAASIALIITARFKGNSTIPFIPFTLIAYDVILLFQ